MYWAEVGASVGIVTALSLIEAIIRYRAYPLSCLLHLKTAWSLFLGYGLCSGVVAGLVTWFIYANGVSSNSPHATKFGVVIASGLISFGVLRTGLAVPGVKKTLTSGGEDAEGSRTAAQVLRSLLSYLLDRLDTTTQSAYEEYLSDVASSLLKQYSFSFGGSGGVLISYCDELASLTGSSQTGFSNTMEKLREDVDRIGGKGFDDSSKALLLLRCCIHRLGKRTTTRAAERVHQEPETP